MYKEMKKIVEVRNKHRNGDEFPDFADLFFFGIKNVRVGRSIGNTPIFLDMMNKIKVWWRVAKPSPTSQRWSYGRGSGVNGAKSCILAISWY